MSWTCATCGVDVDTPHCPSCGEKRLEGKDLTFMGLMGQVFQSLSSIDSRLLTSLYSHMHAQDWSAFARELVAHKLQAAHTTLDAYTPVFDHAVDVNAKSLVILLVLPFTLLLIPLFAGSRRPFVTHLVFALHLQAFLLLCTCVLRRWAGPACARRSWTGDCSPCSSS